MNRITWLVVLLGAGLWAGGASGQDGQTATDRYRASLVHGNRSVIDEAGVFAPEQKAELEKRIEEAWKAGHGALVVAALKTLHGGEIEDFAGKLFEQWGIGEKGKDNGVLLLTAIEDRAVWIEVGYGVEGVLNDAKCGRILDEQVVPRFKEGRHAQGLIDGADVLLRVMGGEALPETAAAAEGGALAGIVFLVIFAVFFILIVRAAIRGGKAGGGGLSGGGFSGGGRSSGGGGFGGFSGGRSGGGGAGRSW